MSTPQTLLLLLLSAAFVAAAVAHGQQSVAAADAVCAKCHADIYRSYLASPSANASGLAAAHLIAGDFTHDPSGVHYTVEQREGKAMLSFTAARRARVTGEHRLDYFLGSGHLGVTYLYTQDEYLIESPVAWYASTRSYDMKPNFGALTEMPPARCPWTPPACAAI